MAGMKDFADLKEWSQLLQRQRLAREKAEAERKQREHQAFLEANLFRLSMATVSPICSEERHWPSPTPPAPIPFQHLADEQAALQESLSDEFDASSLMETDDSLSYRRPGVGIDVLQKLRKGQWVIQAQLDLHGMRRDQAREMLGEFLRRCQRQEQRCVRIIHGKGLGSANKQPVLKQKVKNWLIQKDEVVAFCQATAPDGGSGALIVLLRSLNKL